MHLNPENLVKEKNLLKKLSSNPEKVRSVFYEETKITIILASILGAMPIYPDKSGKPTFKWTSGITIYSLIIFSLASIDACYVLNLHVQILHNFHDKMAFDDKIVIIAHILFLGLYFLPLISFFECKKKAEYFADWNSFEEKYYKITKKPLKCKMKRLQYVFFFGLLLVSIFFVYSSMISINIIDTKYSLNTTLIEKIFLGVLAVYYLWIICSCLGDWIFITLGIRQTAQTLLKDLQNFRLRSHLLDELYGLWLELKYLAEDLGNVFSSTYIYYLCYTFMMVMGSTYSFFANLAIAETENKYEYGAFALVVAVAFGLIADCAHRTINQLGNDFHYELEKILAKERDPTTIRGIKWFIQTLALNPPIISLSGYVSLDRGFNVTMLGTLVTYIVVVLQFRTSSNQQTN